MYRQSTCCPLKCCKDCFEKLSTTLINLVIAGVAGFLFFTGWWCAIDAMAVHRSEFSAHAEFIVPGVASTLAFIIASVLGKTSPAHLNATYMSRSAMWCFRFLLFIAFFISFSMVFIAIVLFSLTWSKRGNGPRTMWPLFFAIPHTCLISAATLMYYFGVRSI